MVTTATHVGFLRSLEVVLTTGCNSACTYCYQNLRGDSMMDWEILRAALDLLLQSEVEETSLTFYGGEPLLELPQIKRAISYMESAGPAGRKTDFHLITNGLLLDRDTARYLARHGVETQISFDGVAAAQNLRAPGTFDHLDRLLVELSEAEESFFNDLCSVSVTVSSCNTATLAESFAYFLARGVRRIAFSPLVTHDPGWRIGLLDTLVEQAVGVLQMSIKHFRRSGETPFAPFQNAVRSAPAHTGLGAMCGAATTDELAVAVDGRISRCVMLIPSYQTFPDGVLSRNLDRLALGDLRDPEFGRRLDEFPEAVMAAGIFEDKQDKYSSYRECGSCGFLHQCSICPVAICHVPGNTDANRVPDLPCAFNLAVLAARELYLEESGIGTSSNKSPSVSRGPG